MNELERAAKEVEDMDFVILSCAIRYSQNKEDDVPPDGERNLIAEFKRIRQEIISAKDKYLEPDSALALHVNYLVCAGWEEDIQVSTRENLNSNQNMFSGEMSEKQYLLLAAIFFRGASKLICDDPALTYLMKCQSALGALYGINYHRKQNSLKATKENNELKTQAIDYWMENKHLYEYENFSNSDWGRLLAKQVPLKELTLSNLVGAIKREMKKKAKLDAKNIADMKERAKKMSPEAEEYFRIRDEDVKNGDGWKYFHLR